MTSAVAPPIAPDAPAIDLDAPAYAPDAVASAAPDRGSKRVRPPGLSRRRVLVRAILIVAAVLAGAMIAQLTLVSSLQQRAQQQRLYDTFRAELAQGIAPTGPLDSEGRAHPIGIPVAYLEIPALGLQQVVVSGTTSSALFAGPGHRRDSVLPGQVGASIIMGRGAAYGGPFASIDQLDEGDEIIVTTGQGEYTYSVLGVRREGDPLPPPPATDESRLVLTTADGPPFLPEGVLRVDATMDGTADRGPGRLFTPDGLPAAERPMGGDTSQLWALALWLQVLIAAAFAAVWSWQRWGRAQTWVVFLPPLMFIGIAVANHAARLLPNLM